MLVSFFVFLWLCANYNFFFIIKWRQRRWRKKFNSIKCLNQRTMIFVCVVFLSFSYFSLNFTCSIILIFIYYPYNFRPIWRDCVYIVVYVKIHLECTNTQSYFFFNSFHISIHSFLFFHLSFFFKLVNVVVFSFILDYLFFSLSINGFSFCSFKGKIGKILHNVSLENTDNKKTMFTFHFFFLLLFSFFMI